MFLGGAHLPKSERIAVGAKDRVIAKALFAARREDELAIDAIFKFLAVPVGPSDAQRADKMRSPRRRRPGLAQLAFDAAHRLGEIRRLAGPTRGIYTRLSAQGVDAKAGIIGERGQSRSVAGRLGLQPRIGGEAGPRLFRLGQSEFARADQRDAIGRHQFAQFAQLAKIMRRQHEPPADAPMPVGLAHSAAIL